MKVKVYKENPAEEKVIRLALHTLSCEGSVILVAVDKDGNELPNGRIGRINDRGMLYLYPGLSDKIGLMKTADGRIHTTNYL